MKGVEATNAYQVDINTNPPIKNAPIRLVRPNVSNQENKK